MVFLVVLISKPVVLLGAPTFNKLWPERERESASEREWAAASSSMEQQGSSRDAGLASKHGVGSSWAKNDG